jgi:tetratricopeptide (TPR) repeat protein
MGDVYARTAAHRFPRVVVAVTASLFLACGTGRVSEVSPAEIPALQEQLSEDPDNGALLLRYAAALFAAERCDTATVVAQNGAAIRPSDALGPLIVGQCLEQRGDYQLAIAVYQAHLRDHGNEPGAATVRAREMFATRAQATEQARAAIRDEAELAQMSGDPDIVGVLPVEVVGDSTYQPLSRGLAHILISDLALLQRFRLVERMRLAALFEELELAQTERVDPSTAARVGHLLQAGQLVQGFAATPQGNTRLEASVILSTGEVSSADAVSGQLRDLMRMEKDLVIGISEQLGYTLSEAERRLILENGTQNLIAFLAYSRGLEAGDRGDFSAAAGHFSEAVRADPSFEMARQQYDAATAAPAAEAATPATVTVSAATSVPNPIPVFEAGGVVDPVNQALTTTVIDVAGTRTELTRVTDQTQTTTRSTNTAVSDPPSTVTHRPPATTGTIRIVFRLP